MILSVLQVSTTRPCYMSPQCAPHRFFVAATFPLVSAHVYGRTVVSHDEIKPAPATSPLVCVNLKSLMSRNADEMHARFCTPNRTRLKCLLKGHCHATFAVFRSKLGKNLNQYFGSHVQHFWRHHLQTFFKFHSISILSIHGCK